MEITNFSLGMLVLMHSHNGSAPLSENDVFYSVPVSGKSALCWLLWVLYDAGLMVRENAFDNKCLHVDHFNISQH